MNRGTRIRVRGQVQGVGFRPFVWQLAQDFDLRGEVLNDPEGVLIHAWGEVDGFMQALKDRAPPLAMVAEVVAETYEGVAPDGFSIAASRGAGNQTRVTPDAATCPTCLAEIRDRQERRAGYAFANCTHCGPRFTILNALPYDRAQTSMADFNMCALCRAEFEDPGDRRFHAQPIACPACGPQVWIEPAAPDPVEDAAARLLRGEVLAIKGLGGFHLACDATNAGAIATLRARKHRPAKPLALMAPLEIVARHGALTQADRALLQSPAAPIVLLPKSAPLPEGLAPGQDTLGWMLPYTPLHHLLLDRVARPLVMSSGNLSGEPQVIGNDEAREKLSGFVDAFVMHDREIARRLDDSVERATPAPMVLRRGRGRVPGALALPKGFDTAPSLLACGGEMKAAICLLKNGEALLSHHLGELSEARTYDAYLDADRDYAALFDHTPEAIAVDLHPEFRATRHGETRATELGVPLLRIQHHHAHLAACLTENGWPLDGGPVAGIILDGLGLGPDGTIWGGELLLGDYADISREAWLLPAALIGGDRAQVEPWRNALMRLDAAGLSKEADRLFPDAPRAVARQAASAGVNAPLSSSAGRLFDAVAACLGICGARQSYEGEAAMRLEACARQARPEAGFEFSGAPTGAIDPSPMMREVIAAQRANTDPGQSARRFHQGLAEAFAARARDLVAQGRARAIALSGGCFQNALLQDMTREALSDLPVLTHQTTPANDGGLALGQAVIAAAQMMQRR